MKVAACLSGIAAALSLTLLSSGPVHAQDEVYDPPEDSGSSDGVENSAEGEVGLDGLTPVESWAPPGAVEFRTAAACHYIDLDYYAIFAVFTLDDATDELWWILIDGLSSSWQYGEIVDATLVDSYESIPHVDCTTAEPYGPAFAVWDRGHDNGSRPRARWARVLWTGQVYGPYYVPYCGTRPSAATSIAYYDGTVGIASGGGGSCGPCFDQFYTDGTWFRQTPITISGGVVRGTSTEWNGDGSFLVAVLYEIDGTLRPTVMTTLVDPGTGLAHSPCPGGIACTPYVGQDNEPYHGIQLVYTSDSTRNPNGRHVIQIDRRTIWVNRYGQLLVDPSNPQRVGPWYEHYASCEYWGPLARVAHTFAWGSVSTLHQHWRATPGSAREVYYLAGGYWPRACSSADTEEDPEVLVVRHRNGFGYSPLAYFNRELED